MSIDSINKCCHLNNVKVGIKSLFWASHFFERCCFKFHIHNEIIENKNDDSQRVNCSKSEKFEILYYFAQNHLTFF